MGRSMPTADRALRPPREQPRQVGRTAVDLPAVASGGTQQAPDGHHDDPAACALASGHPPAEALHIMAIWGTV